MRRTYPAPIIWSKRMSEMGPMRVRSRRRWRISSWPAAKGMRASSAVPMQTEAPSGTKRATASCIDTSLADTRPSYSTSAVVRGLAVDAGGLLRPRPARYLPATVRLLPPVTLMRAAEDEEYVIVLPAAFLIGFVIDTVAPPRMKTGMPPISGHAPPHRLFVIDTVLPTPMKLSSEPLMVRAEPPARLSSGPFRTVSVLLFASLNRSPVTDATLR